MGFWNRSRNARVVCGAILVLGFCVVGALRRVGEAFSARPAVPASAQLDLVVGVYDARFTEVRRLLGTLDDTDRIGYVQRMHPQVHPWAGFFLAQYAVAPTVLDLNDLGPGEFTSPITERYVLGDFHTQPSAEEYLAQTHLEPLHDFDNGLVLFKNPHPGNDRE